MCRYTYWHKIHVMIFSPPSVRGVGSIYGNTSTGILTTYQIQSCTQDHNGILSHGAESCHQRTRQPSMASSEKNRAINMQAQHSLPACSKYLDTTVINHNALHSNGLFMQTSPTTTSWCYITFFFPLKPTTCYSV